MSLLDHVDEVAGEEFYLAIVKQMEQTIKKHPDFNLADALSAVMGFTAFLYHEIAEDEASKNDVIDLLRSQVHVFNDERTERDDDFTHLNSLSEARQALQEMFIGATNHRAKYDPNYHVSAGIAAAMDLVAATFNATYNPNERERIIQSLHRAAEVLRASTEDCPAGQPEFQN